MISILIVVAASLLIVHGDNYKLTQRSGNTWVVEVEGGEEVVQLLAEEHKYEFLGEVGNIFTWV